MRHRILFAAACLCPTGYIDCSEATLSKNPAAGAAISFLLTLINIVCIYFSAYLMFEIKEVRGANTFWKTDIGNVRKFNKAKRHDSTLASIYEKAFLSAMLKPTSTSGESVFSPLERLKGSWKGSSWISKASSSDPSKES